jgi:peptide subunit release factor 1 (eRF1)
MMPLTRQEIEILLDTPDQRDYVVSAYADMTVKDGFNRYVDLQLKNQARAAGEALGESKARKDLEANIAAILEAVRGQADPSARGLAVFSSVARGLRRVLPLDFPVADRLVIDEEPFLLPILEHWHSEPSYLIALASSDEARLFDARRGCREPEPLHDLERDDADQEFQRDKPRFTYKKRFAQTHHERLHGLEDAKFFRDVAGALAEAWKDNHFAGLILLGPSQDTAALRKHLPKELDALVVGEAPHAMTARPEDLGDVIGRLLGDWQAKRERQILAELNERWKRDHLVANGPTEVLDAMQQGRAVQVLIGNRRDLPGARCQDCGYRFGAPVEACPYCQGRCRAVNATQDILRLALRHRVPVHLFRTPAKDDPIARAGGVAALLRAEANWAPNAKVAQESEGHPQVV